MKLTKPITKAQLKTFSEVDVCDRFEVASERTVRWHGSNYEIDGNTVHVTRFFNAFLTSMGSAGMVGACIDSYSYEDEDLTLDEALDEINFSIKYVARAKAHFEEGREKFTVEAVKASMRGYKVSVPCPRVNVRKMF